MGRVLYHLAGVAFIAWVVFAAAKWAFVVGFVGFGVHLWDTRPGSEERERRAGEAKRERPATPEEHVADAVNRASTVTLRLIERRWLDASVEASNPTGVPVDLEGVSCRVLFRPDGGQRSDISNRGPWRMRLEPGAAHRGEVKFHASDAVVATGVAPVALADRRCRLRVRVVPPPSAPGGAPTNPIRIAPGGYRG